MYRGISAVSGQRGFFVDLAGQHDTCSPPPRPPHRCLQHARLFHGAAEYEEARFAAEVEEPVEFVALGVCLREIEFVAGE